MKHPTKLRSRLFEGERRFVHTVGDVEFVTTGLSQPFWHDLYHHLLALRWAAFFLFVSTAFVITNSFFAVLYSLDPGSIADRSPSGFWGAFFFSVETFATVGYGAMHPGNVFGHVVSTVEILV
ncbi:MAG TPA: ion channel, partial [Paraburkholderia sp.]|uniref:ion channel n=1 Tax=Paraburkholderia sp. TaxID=1926495 RepID=UPI002B45DEB2